MTEAREAEVLRHIATLATLAECKTFRAALRDQGETLTTDVFRALHNRTERTAKAEGAW